MSARKSSPVVIPATQAHRHFGDVVRRAFSGKEHFIGEKDGLPVVVIISMAEYEELSQEKEEQERVERVKEFEKIAREFGEEIERRGLTEEEVMAELEKVREEVYQEYYGKRE